MVTQNPEAQLTCRGWADLPWHEVDYSRQPLQRITAFVKTQNAFTAPATGQLGEIWSKAIFTNLPIGWGNWMGQFRFDRRILAYMLTLSDRVAGRLQLCC